MIDDRGKVSLDLPEGSESRSLTLTARTQAGLEIRKIFTFRPDAYGIQVDLADGGLHFTQVVEAELVD